MVYTYVHRKEQVFILSVSIVKMWLFMCNCIYPEAALAFQASSSLAGVGRLKTDLFSSVNLFVTLCGKVHDAIA